MSKKKLSKLLALYLPYEMCIRDRAMAVWAVCRWMSGSNGSSGTSLPGRPRSRSSGWKQASCSSCLLYTSYLRLQELG